MFRIDALIKSVARIVKLADSIQSSLGAAPTRRSVAGRAIASDQKQAAQKWRAIELKRTQGLLVLRATDGITTAIQALEPVSDDPIDHEEWKILVRPKKLLAVLTALKGRSQEVLLTKRKTGLRLRAMWGEVSIAMMRDGQMPELASLDGAIPWFEADAKSLAATLAPAHVLARSAMQIPFSCTFLSSRNDLIAVSATNGRSLFRAELEITETSIDASCQISLPNASTPIVRDMLTGEGRVQLSLVRPPENAWTLVITSESGSIRTPVVECPSTPMERMAAVIDVSNSGGATLDRKDLLSAVKAADATTSDDRAQICALRAIQEVDKDMPSDNGVVVSVPGSAGGYSYLGVPGEGDFGPKGQFCPSTLRSALSAMKSPNVRIKCNTTNLLIFGERELFLIAGIVN